MHTIKMTAKSIAIFGMFCLVSAGAAQVKIAKPEVPEELKVSSGEEVLLRAHAKGVQIYSCKTGPDGKYAWVLKRPIGTHFAGPSWKLNDGSEVIGEVTEKHGAAKSGAVPWLLLKAIGHKGTGLLDKVTSIQRVNTEGGIADATRACAGSNTGTEIESAYSADYYFYAPSK